MKYLDPKADLTFKKIFGTHPDLLISLLNALLPLSEDQQIESIEYLPPELLPQTNELKNSIVDVLCKDIKGRRFHVEMQMEWSKAFKQRVLFNASKLYVSQAHKGSQYSELQPVYSLNLVNDIFEYDVPDYCHNYQIVHDKYSKKVIEGLHFTFFELPKFTPHSIAEKRMTVLWLRFLTEITDQTEEAPTELLENPEISKALEEVETSAYTESQLLAYNRFWDIVSTERTLQGDSFEEGMEKGEKKGHKRGLKEGMIKGEKKGHEKGLKEGLEKGREEEREANQKKQQAAVKNLLGQGVSPELVAQSFSIPLEDVLKLVE